MQNDTVFLTGGGQATKKQSETPDLTEKFSQRDSASTPCSSTTDSQTVYSEKEYTMPLNTGGLLMDVVASGNLEMLDQILNIPSVDLQSAKKFNGQNVLHLAASFGQSSAVEKLLQAGCDPNQRDNSGNTALHEACRGGHKDVVTLLLMNGCNVNAANSMGHTAAHIAAVNGENVCLQILNSFGDADLSLRDSNGLQLAHLAASKGHVDTLEYLHGIDIDLLSYDNNGRTPMHHAAQAGSLRCLVFLVEHDLDLMLADKNGAMPLHIASVKNHLNCVRFIVQQGCSIDTAQPDGKTAAHIAAKYGSIQVLHWLLEKGISTRTEDGDGNTPAHYAAYGGHGDCFNCIVHHGINLLIQNKRGDTPMDAAKKAGCPNLMTKAANGEVACPLCTAKHNYFKWQEENGPPPVLKEVSKLKDRAYTNPVPPSKKIQQKPKENSTTNIGSKNTNNPKETKGERDLAARYFGKHYLD